MLSDSKSLDESTLLQHFQQVGDCVKGDYGRESGYVGMTPSYHAILIFHTGVSCYITIAYFISTNAKALCFACFELIQLQKNIKDSFLSQAVHILNKLQILFF